MSLVAKVFITALMLFFIIPTNAKNIYILNLQENDLKKCMTENVRGLNGIYRLGIDGVERSLAESIASMCLDEKILIPFARKLIEEKKADRVIFLTINQENSKFEDWINNGEIKKKLASGIETANLKKIKFDYGVWQGGLINRSSLTKTYVSSIRKIVKSVSLSISVEKWLIGLSTSCDRAKNEPGMNIRKEPLLNRFSGPDIGILGTDYRSDTCTLNDAGRDELGKLWIKAFVSADEKSLRYQKESLLYYFK